MLCITSQIKEGLLPGCCQIVDAGKCGQMAVVHLPGRPVNVDTGPKVAWIDILAKCYLLC